MITGLQALTQKHYQWFFGILLVIIIASFIFAYGPASRLVEGKSPFHESKLFLGYDLDSPDVVRELTQAAGIHFYLKNGYTSYNSDELQNEVVQRIVELKLADELGINMPSDEELGHYLTTLAAFKDAQGLFSRAKYEKLMDSFKAEEGENTLSERLAECWRLDQLEKVFEGGAYYLPESLKREAALRGSSFDVLIASAERPQASATPISEEAARQYFSSHTEAYQTAEKRTGIYYNLPAEKFIDKVETPSDAVLKKYFDKVSLRFVKWQTTENGKTTGEKPTPPTYEEHQAETLALYKEEKAARLAAEAVDAIVSKIYTDKIAPESPAWGELIKASGLTASPVGPVAVDAKTDNLPEEVVSILFSIGTRPYSGAFQSQSSGGFVYLQSVEKPKAQTFEDVRASATADAQKAQDEADFAASSKAVLETLTKAVSSEEFQKSAQNAGWKVEAPKAFLLQAPAEALRRQSKLLQGLITAQAGTVLNSTSTDKALAVFVKAVTLPEFSMTTPSAQEAKEMLDANYGKLRGLSALNEWGMKGSK
jgi:hypothetical protein